MAVMPRAVIAADIADANASGFISDTTAGPQARRTCFVEGHHEDLVLRMRVLREGDRRGNDALATGPHAVAVVDQEADRRRHFVGGKHFEGLRLRIVDDRERVLRQAGDITAAAIAHRDMKNDEFRLGLEGGLSRAGKQRKRPA